MTLFQDPEARQLPGFYLYTEREPENEAFPFEPWSRMVAEARRICEQTVQPHWLGANQGAAAALARRMFDSCELDLGPALADALHRAGCEQQTLLHALRPPSEPAQACWVVELLLGQEPGSFIKR